MCKQGVIEYFADIQGQHETKNTHCCEYMQGMGEPLNNYSQVRSAVSMMIDSQVFALRRSAVTVSTVGVIPRMLQMIDDLPGVSLALSLHAPTQELRKTLVPSAKAYPLDKLMAAVDRYQMQTRQKVCELMAVALAAPHWATSHQPSAAPFAFDHFCPLQLSWHCSDTCPCHCAELAVVNVGTQSSQPMLHHI